MHRTTFGILVIAAACAGPRPAPQVPAALLDAPGPVTAPEPVAATGHVPALPARVTLDDLTPPASAPRGEPLALPRMPWVAGERVAVWTTSGGHESATADTYEAIQTIDAIDVDLVTESRYDVLAASMSSFGGGSSLRGTYRIKFAFDREHTTFEQVVLQDAEGADLDDQLAREELSELGDRAILLPWSALRVLHDVPLRAGETKELTADEKRAMGSNPAEGVWFARLPDEAGVAIFRIYRHLVGGGDLFRMEVRYDTRTHKPVRVERIDAPSDDLSMWYAVVTELGPPGAQLPQ